MRKILSRISISIILILINTHILFSDNSNISPYGYVDIRYLHCSDPSTNNEFQIGQAELGAESKISNKINHEITLYYDSISDALILTTFSFDFKIKDNYSISAGQFDIPLGTCLNYYSSPDRPLISHPLLCDKIYNFWYDIGIKLSGNYKRLNGVVYIADGSSFGEKDYVPQAFGERVGIKIGNGEIGVSIAEDKTTYDCFKGIDFTYTIFSLDFVSEYFKLTNDNNNNVYSYFIQTKYNFGRMFLVGRYDNYTEEDGYDRDEDSYSSLSALSLGIGMSLCKNIETRIEFQQNFEDHKLDEIDNNILYVQTVLHF